DGIRDFHVTGVQTCALPISSQVQLAYKYPSQKDILYGIHIQKVDLMEKVILLLRLHVHASFLDLVKVPQIIKLVYMGVMVLKSRSEERRVGKECRMRVADDR